MRATIDKCGSEIVGYGLDVWDEKLCVESEDFDTAQEAFDYLEDIYPGIPTEVNIQ